MLIEQAIFTSAQTDRADGYQVVGRSPGVSDEAARDLAVWCPSHDSLLDEAGATPSYNFHSLAGGAWCISKSVSAGAEYSGRGGLLVYTHCLIASAEALSRFANNPFAIAKAALAGGAMQTCELPAARLAPLSLVGRAAPVDRTLLAQLAGNPGPAALARLVEAALGAKRVIVVGKGRGETVLAGLVNCLCVESRPGVSFSTGLKFSASRPLQVVWLGSDRQAARRLARQFDAALVDLDDLASPAPPEQGWPGLVAAALASGRTGVLASSLSGSPEEVSAERLAAHGDALRAQILQDQPAGAPKAAASPACAAARNCAPSSAPRQRADGAHRRRPAAVPVAAGGRAAPRSQLPAAALDPMTLDLLECLDDAVYEAIGGDASALARLELLWPVVQERVGPRLIEESREQYLRFALGLWSDSLAEELRDPQRATCALDVLCLLFAGEEAQQDQA